MSDTTPVVHKVSTRFSVRYTADGHTWKVGPDIEVGATTGPRGGPPGPQFVNVYGCAAGRAYAALEFLSLGFASIGVDPTTKTLQISFLPTMGLPVSCAEGSYAFPVPFGPAAGGVGQVTYDATGTTFAGTVYDQAGTTPYTIQGKAASFGG